MIKATFEWLWFQISFHQNVIYKHLVWSSGKTVSINYAQEWLTDVCSRRQGHSLQKLAELLLTHWLKNTTNKEPKSIKKSRGSLGF